MSLQIILSPAGRLSAAPSEEAEPKLTAAAADRLLEAFAASAGEGLELLAGEFLQTPVPMTLAFWRLLARQCLATLCHQRAPGDPTDQVAGVRPQPAEKDLQALVDSAPPMSGLEYLTPSVLAVHWEDLEKRAADQIARAHSGDTQAFLRSLNPAWHALGRVTFHLAENKRDPERPFAFLATYAHRLSDQGKVQHLPLGRALQEYAGARNRAGLTALLSPVQRAAEKSGLARELLESRAIFQPQMWTPREAYRFLNEIPQLEESGLRVRIPNWWKSGRPPRPHVAVRIGEHAEAVLGKGNLLDFKVEVALEGQPLTEKEWQAVLQANEGLVYLKGQWVEVDSDRLRQVLDHWKKVQKSAENGGVPLIEGLRLLSGFDPKGAPEAADTATDRPAWAAVSAGEWFQRAIEQIQSPRASADSDPGPALRATLRPYQRDGAHWLWTMNSLGLGACLADDMGLGKTVQVIALLLARRRDRSAQRRPSVLLVPASLIANWRAEIHKFAPSLSVLFAHPSESPAELMAEVAAEPLQRLASFDLVITSYGMLRRLPWLKASDWEIAILDEAQAIKNPGARQTRDAKELHARHRIALTGTPIENRLSDLWSLFDFLCPGLLGTTKDFAAFIKGRSAGQAGSFAPLRRLIRPYVLRRMKTDRRIIADLPEKTELDAFCSLSRPQAVLYEQAVRDLERQLAEPDAAGIRRRGLILAFLTRFKQICNHPSHWLGDGVFAPKDSGKFQRLAELVEEIASRQEKMLVFTQYRQMTDPLAGYLAALFGRAGLVLHGGTAVGRRQALVDEFQREGGPPFFILSLKAGGAGLNLTAASHVIHFDRWWNPAVENQATDRAFRIGQKRNVMVHKFICRGTLEEKIHALIASKVTLANDILGEGTERLLTEMKNDELMKFVALDIKSVAEE